MAIEEIKEINEKIEALLAKLNKRGITTLDEKDSLLIVKPNMVNIYLHAKGAYADGKIAFSNEEEREYLLETLQQKFLDSDLTENKLRIEVSTVRNKTTKQSTEFTPGKITTSYYELTKDLFDKARIILHQHSLDSVGLDENKHLFVKFKVEENNGKIRFGKITSEAAFFGSKNSENALKFLKENLENLEKSMLTEGTRLSSTDLLKISSGLQKPVEHTAETLRDLIKTDANTFLKENKEFKEKEAILSIDSSGTKNILNIFLNECEIPIGKYLLSNKFHKNDALEVAANTIAIFGFNIKNAEKTIKYNKSKRFVQNPIKNIISGEEPETPSTPSR